MENVAKSFVTNVRKHTFKLGQQSFYEYLLSKKTSYSYRDKTNANDCSGFDHN